MRIVVRLNHLLHSSPERDQPCRLLRQRRCRWIANLPWRHGWALVLPILLLIAIPVQAQRPETTERRVENPVGAAEAEVKARRRVETSEVVITAETTPQTASTVEISSDYQSSQGDVLLAQGNVQVRYGDIFLIAERVEYDRMTGELRAEGNVYFEQEGQRLVGTRLEFNARTKLGTIQGATAFTNRTPDGTVVIVDADQVDKLDTRTYGLRRAILTACQEAVPKWSLTASRARIELNERAKVYHALLRLKNIPVFYVPYASISISRKDRSSGFLLPGSGSSTLKGRTLNIAYYQTLGRSADILIRGDLFSKRGIGLGYDFRARPDETSRINFGSFLVFDRLFGEKGVDQGGSSFYADAGYRTRNGFVLAADVNVTSSFAFRQIFAENIQAAISPEERFLLYVTRNWGANSFNAFFGEQSSFIGDQVVKVRRLPSFEWNRRSTRLRSSLPFYFSFEGAVEGVRRSETSGGRVDLKTPSAVQRFDLLPRLTLPLPSWAGFKLTPTLAFRSTFYSDSLDPVQREVVGRDLHRQYVDFGVDLRAPALARIFRRRDGSPWFKHLIEPFVEYRRITGIDRFDRTLRVDERDVVAGTNELAFGVSNSFLVRRVLREGEAPQAHELLNVTIQQKYFFDPTFGGAFREGVRNQFFPINTLAGFAFGGALRQVSPINLRTRWRPNDLLFGDLRVNYDPQLHGLRDIIVGSGIRRGLVSFSQNWYITRRVRLDQQRFDPSSLLGNQVDFSTLLGNPARGLYAGVNLIYDLRDRRFDALPRERKLINFTTSLGWAWDCCSLNIQNVTFNAGLRNENRILFAFTFKGIGTFGTDTLGQQRPR